MWRKLLTKHTRRELQEEMIKADADDDDAAL